MKLRIYPCFDSLLYFPVYVALELMRHNVNFSPAFHDGRTWSFGTGGAKRDEASNEIILEELDTPGDERAVQMLLNPRYPDDLAIAVADPMHVFEHNVNNSTSQAETTRLKVIATFLDRIALWAVGDPRHLKKKLGQERYKLLKQRRRPDPQALKSVRIAYWEGGHTNQYLVKDLASRRFKSTTFDPESLTGGAELALLDGKKYDLVLTNNPWARFYNNAGPDVIDLFSPAPFPFSSIICTEKVCKSPSGLVLDFLNHLRVAVALSSRDPQAIFDYLYMERETFGHYGLPADLNPEQHMNLIALGIEEIVYSGCLCEQLTSTWTAWDFALSIKFGQLYQTNKSHYKDVFTSTVNNGFVATIKAGQDKAIEFLDTQFGSVLISFLRSHASKRVGNWEGH